MAISWPLCMRLSQTEWPIRSLGTIKRLKGSFCKTHNMTYRLLLNKRIFFSVACRTKHASGLLHQRNLRSCRTISLSLRPAPRMQVILARALHHDAWEPRVGSSGGSGGGGECGNLYEHQVWGLGFLVGLQGLLI